MNHNRYKRAISPVQDKAERLDSQPPSPFRGRQRVCNRVIDYLASYQTPYEIEFNSPPSPHTPLHASSKFNDDTNKHMPLVVSHPPRPKVLRLNTQSSMSSDADVPGQSLPVEKPMYDLQHTSSSPTFISTSPMRPSHIEDRQSSLSFQSTTPIQNDRELPLFESPISPWANGARSHVDNLTSFDPWSHHSPRRPVIWGSEVDVQILPVINMSTNPTQSPPYSIFEYASPPQSNFQHFQSVPLPYYGFPERDSLAPGYLPEQPQEEKDDMDDETDYFGDNIRDSDTLRDEYNWAGHDAENRILAAFQETPDKAGGDLDSVTREEANEGKDEYDWELDDELLLLASYEQQSHEVGDDLNSGRCDEEIDDGDENDADDEWPL